MASSVSPGGLGRSQTMMTMDDDAPLGEDTSEVTKLFHERLQAWKHACGYLEEYIKSTEKMQTAHGKEYEKVLKTINSPLREPEHFDHSPGGISGMFDLMRTNTQAISNAHTQTAATLKGSVLPIFERLHVEIKNKQKELAKGVGKGAKAVEKAKAESQKHIDLLGSSSASFDRLSGKDAGNDPYLVHRGIHHRLHKQFQEENSSRQDMLSVQSNFSQFESHIVQVFQQGMALFSQTVGNQSEQQKTFYNQMAENGQAIEPLREWNGFVSRNSSILIDPNATPKTLANASFANQGHHSTEPLLQGVLERKQGLMRKFEGSPYVLTPAKFLHEVKGSDDLAKDPSADLSLFLPDCTVGALNGNLFTIKGKDVSKGKLGTAMNTVKEYEFKTSSAADASSWYGVISNYAGKRPGDALSNSSPVSPTGSLAIRNVSNPISPTSPTATQGTWTVGEDGIAREVAPGA